MREFLNCRKPLTPGPDESGGHSSKEIPLCQTHSKGFTLTFEDVAYEVEPRPPFTGKLAVAIKGRRNDGAGRKFRDRCDLTAARSRAETVRVMSQTLTLTRERAEVHLIEILEATEAWVDAGLLSSEAAAAPVVLTEAQKLEAFQFLQVPDLFCRLQDDI